MAITHEYGLIGYPLEHSFSKRYFTEKFAREGITGHVYQLFPITAIEELPALLAAHPNLQGLNVTIPYKQAVLPLLDELDENARAVGAVNTIRIRDGRLQGFNTDIYGFERSLRRFLQTADEAPGAALVLGTGGASKAVRFVLERLHLAYLLVSRHAERGDLVYEDLDRDLVATHPLIINTTPLGMAPAVDTHPDLPYQYLTAAHFLYDLVYNPEKTVFLTEGEKRGAATMNGLEMLYLQAEKAWDIWNAEERFSK